MTIKSFFASAAVALVVLGNSSCDKRDQNINFPAGVTDNVATVAAQNNLRVFAAAVKAANMDTAFQYLGQYTIFAPTDSAFNAAGITEANVSTLPAATLAAVLRQHILSGRTGSLSLLPGPNAAYRPINREFLYTSTYLPVTGSFAGVFFNGKRLVKADILANNGIIHTVNGVLLPASNTLTDLLSANSNLSFLQAAINRAGLLGTLQGLSAPVTFLAPTNAAFQAAGFADVNAINNADPVALGGILRNHVIANGAAGAALRRLFSCDFRAQSYTALNGNVTVSFAGGVPRFRGAGNTADASPVVVDLMYRSGVTGLLPAPYPANTVGLTGAPNVLHVIDRVLLP